MLDLLPIHLTVESFRSLYNKVLLQLYQTFEIKLYYVPDVPLIYRLCGFTGGGGKVNYSFLILDNLLLPQINELFSCCPSKDCLIISSGI